MDRKLLGEPGVYAFLRAVRRELRNRISQMKNDNTYNRYDRTEDLKKLNVKLLFFQDLLVDGEARRLGEECVDEWMDDIKDLLYDVEDILDDLKSQCFDDQVRLHELNKKNVECLIKIFSRIEELRDTAKDLKLERGRGENSNVFGRTRETTSMVDKYEIIHGREEDKNAIVKRLLEVDDKGKQSYDVLCLVGMGGLGKTTLAQLVFNDPKVARHFDVMSWVCISNVFDFVKATKELIVNSNANGSAVDNLPLESLQRRLREIVEKKKFLFVLDDVWSSTEWQRMKVPFGSCANGSKILVTTRKIKIAHAFGNFDYYPVQELNHEQCMKIFRDKAFGDDKGEQNKEVLVGKIVRACKGVPLVVRVIGSMLRLAGVEKWRVVSENTATWVNENDEIHPAIRFSYDDLPAFLKRCFEYLAIFPPDFIFDQDDVVRLWIADGLVQEVDGRKAEDIGAEYYNELKARSLIQKNEKKRDKMHDIVHHLATVVSTKFCYKKNSNNSPARVRHAFVDNWEKMHFEFLAQAPCLRTLIVKNSRDRNLVQDIITSCKMLRTLKIGDDYYVPNDDYYVPNDWNLSLGGSVIDQLTHIRYLSIPNSDRHLPDSLCMLNNLLFLVFGHSKYLENLPDGMNSLSNLHFLRVDESPMLSLPESICALSELQILDLNGCRSLTEVPKNIGNLRSLRNLNLLRTAISSLPESICTLGELQTLHLYGCKSLIEIPKDIGNLRSLLSLNLNGTTISSLPESICALSDLQTLHLYGCKYLIELPKDIGNLTSLLSLNLGHTTISSLPESICALRNLQTLHLYGCKSLTELPKDIGNLTRLLSLNIGGTTISSLPKSICALSDLQTLHLYGCKSLPKDIGNLTRLLSLNLGCTTISRLPKSICALGDLQTLRMYGCKSLTELPKDIGNLRSLLSLNLGGTTISSLPESICALSDLQTLLLHRCKSLIELPNDIGNLRSLQSLRLDGTAISSLPESICALSELQTLYLNGCKSLIELPKDIGNLRNLRELKLGRRELCVPLSILNVTGLLDNHFALHIGRVTDQEEKNEKGFDIVTIGGVEDALMADLKSKNIPSLQLCCWSWPGDDEKLEVKIMEALEPHHALQSLEFTNYRGDNLPAWIMPSNICYSNLRNLEMEGFDKICEMVDMEFVSLEVLEIKNCPKLKKILMATPKLDELYLKNCGELEAVDLLPSLSDKDGMHSIVSQLWALRCEYNIFEYLFEKLKTVNSKWDKLEVIRLSGGGRRFASLPGGWPSMMESLCQMDIWDIPPGKLQLLPDGNESAFPPSLRVLYINNCRIEEQPPHHSYIITWERKDESEEEDESEQEEEEE